MKKSMINVNKADVFSNITIKNKTSAVIYFVWLILLITGGSFFLLLNLDNWYLWQDEANAALLSKNILKFGYPYVFDGKNLIWPDISDVSPNSFYWILWGWLPLYLNALSFLIMGISTFSARLSSAVIGIIFFFSAFIMTYHTKLSKKTAFLYSAILLFSTPLLLYFRQCGYYTISVFCAFNIFYVFFTIKNKNLRTLMFILNSLFLLNTNILIWGIVLCSIFFVGIIYYPFKNTIKLFTLNIIINAPFLYLYEFWRLFNRMQYHDSSQSLTNLYERLIFYFKALNDQICPWWLFLIISFTTLFMYRKLDKPEKNVIMQCLLFSIFSIALTVIITSFQYFRYIIYIIPFIYLLIAIVTAKLFDFSKIAGSLLLGIIFIFNILNFRLSTNGNYFQLPYFIYEITNEMTDINEELCKYLSNNIKSSDTILCNYGEFPLLFYTPAFVRGGAGGIGLTKRIPYRFFNIDNVTKPDWIIIRRNWEYLYPSQIFKYFLKKYDYEKIKINVQDTQWGNRPSPYYHFYTTPFIKQPLFIYKLKKEN